MKRPARILLNVVLPPLVAALCFSAASFGISLIEYFKNSESPFVTLFAKAGSYSLLYMFVAYYIAIIPSLLHASFMELIYRKHPAHAWSAVSFSSLSGSCSGLFISAFFAFAGGSTLNDNFLGGLFWIGLGLLVGFLVGLIIKKIASRYLARNAVPPASINV